MSLADELSSSSVRRKIVNVSEVRVNPLNFYPIDEVVVKSIAESIQEFGQLENATVYEEDLNDGCRYTLIGGETRWRAVCLNVEEELSDGEFHVVVIEKPANMEAEIELIREDNKQREKDKKTRAAEVKAVEKQYEYLRSQGQTPQGLKRDWIGRRIGISGRQVSNILKEEITQQNGESGVAHNEVHNTPTVDDVNKNIKKLNKLFEKTVKLCESAGCSDIETGLREVWSELEDRFF